MNSILVKLDVLKDETISDGGIISVAFEAGYSEGGKPKAQRSSKKYQSRGEIIQISPSARKFLDETILADTDLTIDVGDIVLIEPGASGPNREYIIDREEAVAGDKGYVLINAAEIQSKEIN